MPLTAGDKLGPYEIISLIGKGGIGEVYCAHDLRTGRDVAVKVSAEPFNKRFGREVRTWQPVDRLPGELRDTSCQTQVASATELHRKRAPRHRYSLGQERINRVFLRLALGGRLSAFATIVNLSVQADEAVRQIAGSRVRRINAVSKVVLT
jgi:serine/threonine protein kinase